MRRHRNDIDLNLALKMYSTGKYTISEVAESQHVCTGTMFYALRDAGCIFTRKRRKPMSEKERRRRSEFFKGRKLTERQKRLIGEKNSCNYNGLNGYGHIKHHNHGYLLTYVPKHPHASRDGYVMLHTVLVERNIGRYLEDDEVVHHANHDRSDNRLENLVLMKKKEHMSMHMKERYAKRRNDLSICL